MGRLERGLNHDDPLVLDHRNPQVLADYNSVEISIPHTDRAPASNQQQANNHETSEEASNNIAQAQSATMNVVPIVDSTTSGPRHDEWMATREATRAEHDGMVVQDVFVAPTRVDVISIPTERRISRSKALWPLNVYLLFIVLIIMISLTL